MKLFMSKQDRERERERAIRRGLAKAKRRIGRRHDTVNLKKQDRDKAMNEVRAHLRAGQKNAALEAAQSVRSYELQISRMQSKTRKFERVIAKMEDTSDEDGLLTDLSSAAALMKSDIKRAEDLFFKLGEMGEEGIDHLIDDFVRDDDREATGAADSVPTAQAILDSLSAEVAAEVRSGTQGAKDSLVQEMAASRQKLKAYWDESSK